MCHTWHFLKYFLVGEFLTDEILGVFTYFGYIQHEFRALFIAL